MMMLLLELFYVCVWGTFFFKDREEAENKTTKSCQQGGALFTWRP